MLGLSGRAFLTGDRHVHFEAADRLRQLPPYLFAEIDRKKKAAIAAGRDVINLGVGDPDTPTPAFIIEALRRAAGDPANHQYALDAGLPPFRRAAADWFKRRFGVTLDVEAEILPTIGSKEAIGHFPLAVLNPGDVALIPEPGYPPYRSGTVFAGAEPVTMPLAAANDFLPDLEAVPADVLDRARLIYVNYPNNPTARIAPRDFYERLVAFAKRHDLIVASDAAYTEVYFEEAPMSLLEVPGAKDVVVEFHSLSKTFNMTGWRIGFACGNAELVAHLGRIKSNLDSGIFGAIQVAGAEAYDRAEEVTPGLNGMYRARRDAFVVGLREAGWEVTPPEAAFYVWIPTPQGLASAEVASRLLDEADIVVTPGVGFGPSGEGYVRATLTVSEDRLAEAAERIGGIDF
jgi:LL-diaminopimelate aminotransferase